jgi:hypothetical protein
VEATAKGFQLNQVPPFTLTVGQKASINFALVIGSASTVVTVQDITPQLDVSSANLGTVIATKQVNDLPLNGRNFTQLLQLTPGVSPVSVLQCSGRGSWLLVLLSSGQWTIQSKQPVFSRWLV